MLWLLGCVIGRASRLPERKPRGDSVLRINAILKAMRWPHLLIGMTNRSRPTTSHAMSSERGCGAERGVREVLGGGPEGLQEKGRRAGEGTGR